MINCHGRSQHVTKIVKRIKRQSSLGYRSYPQIPPNTSCRAFTPVNSLYQAPHKGFTSPKATTCYNPKRTFLPSPPNAFSTPSSPQVLHAQRNLPYEAPALYDLVADIASYPTFLPFCTGTKILAYSSPDHLTGARKPALASLGVGWKGITEEFVSRVHCIPAGVVEAVSGAQGQSSMDRVELEKWGYDGKENADETRNDIFESLNTRWSLHALEEGKGTEVDLRIEVVWKNVLYAAMAQAAADKVATIMIQAFEERAKDILG